MVCTFPGLVAKMPERRHSPVMLRETLEHLAPKPGEVVFDATLGLAGHAIALMEAAGPGAKLFATDWDPSMIELAKLELAAAGVHDATIWEADYKGAAQLLSEAEVQPDAILLDLGVSSVHLDEPERGFSFKAEAPLDMRMHKTDSEPASAFLNRATAGEIETVLLEYGGENWARKIAQKIVERGKVQPIKTTTDLVDCVLSAIPPRMRDKRIHPATRTFQAVRIHVNGELSGLEEALKEIALCLAPRGRMVVLSYHSGEDRATKRAFQTLAATGDFSTTKKPLQPGLAEIQDNPRSRSAKLRALTRRSD